MDWYTIHAIHRFVIKWYKLATDIHALHGFKTASWTNVDILTDRGISGQVQQQEWTVIIFVDNSFEKEIPQGSKGQVYLMSVW